MKGFLKRHVVDRLPTSSRCAIERLYYRFCAVDRIREEISLYRQLCHREKNAVDIGANCGDVTLFLCRLSQHVYCFEPVPWQAEFLRRRFQGRNVTVHDCALGSSEQDLPLRIPVTGTRRVDTRSSLVGDFAGDVILGEEVTKVEEVRVQVKRLDSFNLENVGLIKIDVEGFEFEVFEGAKKTIKADMPNLLIEIERRHLKNRSVEDVFCAFQSLDYCGYFVWKGKLRPVKEFDVRTMQDPANETTPSYVNNFVFSPSADLQLKL